MIKVVKTEFNENENSKILIKIQEEIAKIADMLAKHDNKNKIKLVMCQGTRKPEYPKGNPTF